MDRTLSKGMTGSDVRAVQDALNYQIRRGFTPLVVDGIFGPKTQARVIEFQNSNGILTDGIVGPQTKGLLFEVTEVPIALLVIEEDVLVNADKHSPSLLYPVLNWSGEGLLPYPVRTEKRHAFEFSKEIAHTLFSDLSSVNALSFRLTVPSRKDPRDKDLPQAPSIQMIDMTDGLSPTKYKLRLPDGTWSVSGSYVVMLPRGGWGTPFPKVTKKYAPKMFAWGISPGWHSKHGIGFNAAAQFMVRVTDGSRDRNGRLKPQVDVGCWGDAVVRFNFGYKPTVPYERAHSFGEFHCGSFVRF